MVVAEAIAALRSVRSIYDITKEVRDSVDHGRLSQSREP
jgi:hypothetical protein